MAQLFQLYRNVAAVPEYAGGQFYGTAAGVSATGFRDVSTDTNSKMTVHWGLVVRDDHWCVFLFALPFAVPVEFSASTGQCRGPLFAHHAAAQCQGQEAH